MLGPDENYWVTLVTQREIKCIIIIVVIIIIIVLVIVIVIVIAIVIIIKDSEIYKHINSCKNFSYI